MASSSETLGELEEAQKVTDEFVALDIGDRSAVSSDLEVLKEICDSRKSELREFTDAVMRKGAKGVAQEIKTGLEKWREIELNIAVTGVSGSGKSSFINAVRRLQPTMEGAAPVGVVETTRTIKKYQHPHNTKVQFWDLPGVGTHDFRRDNYLEKVSFTSFDFYIIMTAGRFREDDLWLANEIQKIKKSFYFVRAMIDKDIANDRHDYPETHNEEQVLSQVLQNCKTGLIQGGFPNASIFLISNRLPALWDFPKLEAQILEDIPDLKREVALHMMRSSCEPIIRKKAEQLRSRAWKVALLSSLADLVPFPGISIAVDMATIVAESKHYSETFGVNWLELDKQQAVGGKYAGMKKAFGWLASISSSVVARLVAKFAVGETLQTVLGTLLPFVGGLISFSISVPTTLLVLRDIINNMEEAALVAIEESSHNIQLK